MNAAAEVSSAAAFMFRSTKKQFIICISGNVESWLCEVRVSLGLGLNRTSKQFPYGSNIDSLPVEYVYALGMISLYY